MNSFVSYTQPGSNTQQGIVYRKTKGIYTVHTTDRQVQCALSPRLHTGKGELSKSSDKRRGRASHKPSSERTTADPVAVGDVVQFVETPGAGGQIVEILPRRNRFSRRSAVPMPSAHASEQVIVVNVDQVVPVFAAANPRPKWGMLDRYLVSAESLELESLVCVTKLDLVDPDDPEGEELEAAVAEYRRIGYPVVLVSAVTGQGLDEVRQALAGRTSVFVGKSGVGKTSLLNALQPELGLRVNAVSEVTGKGKHTTTHMEMFPLDFGGAIVDTPGVREFGLWDVDEMDLALLFPEMRPWVGQCRFGLDCRHDEEPGCAVRRAVMDGQISPQRYQSYQRLKVDP